MLGPSDVAGELDADRVTGDEGGELLAGEPVVDGHAVRSSLWWMPGGKSRPPEDATESFEAEVFGPWATAGVAGRGLPPTPWVETGPGPGS